MWWNRDHVELKPGVCECHHSRCGHTDGTGRCHAHLAPHSTYNTTDQWLLCGCQIFIFHHQSPQQSSEDQELKELKKMTGL